MTTPGDDSARELHDRLAIHRLVLAYCRAVDRGDFDGVRARLDTTLPPGSEVFIITAISGG